MFTASKVLPEFKKLIGWKDHYNTTDIPALGPTLNISDSGEFYQDYHPALRLDVVKTTLPSDRTLEAYLTEKVETGITQLLNDVVSQKKFGKYAKQTLANDVILDSYGWTQDTVINEGRFVGFKIKTNLEIGLRMVLKQIGFQFNTDQPDFTLYVFHSSKKLPVKEISVTTTDSPGWTWIQDLTDLEAESKDISGGVWVVGYYQDDIVGNAIKYTDYDWIKGPCGSCDGGRQMSKWRRLSKYMDITPIYVPSASFTVGEMFDLRASFEVAKNNWGMNFKISAECDLSDFFVDHKFSLKTALALKVTQIILKDISFSQQLNYVEESLKQMIVRDLEGDVETNSVNIVDQLAEEIKGVNFDHSKLSPSCLPCDTKRGASYGVA